jgi:hypothetical protein
MKRSYSIPALCTAAGKHFCYDIQDGHLYLADIRGTFGLKTDDLSVLDDLRSRPTVTLETRSPARALQSILDTRDTAPVRHTGIFIPKSAGLCAVLRNEENDQVILVNEALLAPFKPTCIIGTTRRAPIILVNTDCFAVICPVNDTREELANALRALDDTLHG